jgi:hypothetical protein
LVIRQKWLSFSKITANVFALSEGGEFYIHPPGTAAWLFDKVKY